MVSHSPKKKEFNPEKDVPDLSGKVVFVTGGTAGLGKQTMLELAKHNPERIYFTGRNTTGGELAMEEIKATVPNANLTFIPLDLASLSSVKEAITILEIPRLDILICNAGIMAVPPELTKDGYEIQFGTNHIGHALFIKLLLPTLLSTASSETTPARNARIVLLTSQGFIMHPVGGIVFKDLHTPQNSPVGGPWIRYGQSKLANLLYAAELSRRFPQLTCMSIHPGVINTGLVSGLSMANRMLVRMMNVGKIISLEEGAYNTLWAATVDKEQVINGEYYEPVGKLGAHARETRNQRLAAELWDWTEKELGPYIP